MIRTRFAPSPTGSLHVGNARIAILNWLFSRHHGGTFILRIEDTDRDRNVAGSEAGIRNDLLWLGLDWDEGPEHGDHGPYRQSERDRFYTRCADHLLEIGAAYHCFCEGTGTDQGGGDDHVADEDRATVEQTTGGQVTGGQATGAPSGQRRHGCPCADLPRTVTADRAREQPAAVRFRVPENTTIVFNDVVRGEIRVDSSEIADFVLLRADGRPTYNFAVVIDDMHMHVTHVIRGTGHLSNTPRQVLLFDRLEAQRPVFVHVPMVLGDDRRKLSKRHGAHGMGEYRAAGYHPDALLNYLSLLSWSSESGEEVLTRDDLIAQVSLDRIGASDVVFDPVKLRWLSARHIERMGVDELAAAVRPFIDVDATGGRNLDDEKLRAIIAASRTHLSTFADIGDVLASYFGEPSTTVDGPVIEAARTVLTGVDLWEEDALKDAIREVGRVAGVKGRALYEPLRLALTGHEHGPPMPTLLFVLGRETVLERLS